MPKQTKKKTKEVTKPMTDKQVHTFIKTGLAIKCDEKVIMKKMAEDLIPALLSGDRSDEIDASVSETAMELMRIRESEYHCNLMETFSEQYRGLAKQLTTEIINQYDCKTEVEKSLASTITASYVRYLDNSRRLNNELQCKDITKNRNVYIANLSKQTDRVHRQYLSSLMTLKQLKSPQIEMNIRANTAFVSQNQQINSQQKNNETK
jgi:hypothetical protein